MAVFGVYITKRESFRGGSRIFGNTYHFKTGTGQVFNDEAVARQVMEAEQPLLSSDVDFEGYQTWGPTDGSEFENVMRDSGDFDTSGEGASQPAMFAEVCALVVWPLPRSETTNRRRWLRKFLRLSPGQLSLSDGVLRGAERIDADTRRNYDAYVTMIDGIQSAVDPVQLCTDDGTEPNAEGTVRPYLFTRQIGS